MINQIVFVVVATALLGCGLARGADTQPATQKSSLSDADRQFVVEAAKGGMAEVEMGRLALQKGSSDDVRKFAQRMVTDHSKANAELMQVARAKGIDLPSAADDQHKQMMEKLSKLQGAEFDKAYMSHMLEDHNKDVGEFQKQSKDAQDAEVKAFANKTLPTLQEHLQMAMAISQKMGVKAGG